MTASVQSMKSMRLYDQVDRINTEIRALGISDDAPLRPEQLIPFDQYHYHGTAAVEEALAQLGARPETRILEIGSGIGGPARWMAHKAGCLVTALELQPDLDELAANLTRRCGLDDKVRHVCGNFLDGPLRGERFDAITSLLCFLHIPDRDELFSQCAATLEPGGAMVIEDFTKCREPDAAQWDDLRLKLQCSWLPDKEVYHQQLVNAGFDIITFEDKSSSWQRFTADRLAAFRHSRARNIEMHGQEIIDGLDDFYATVANMFADGILGGAHIMAKLGRKVKDS